MIGYTFNIEKPLTLTMTGKFVSPFPEWMHMNRVLMDYELFIQTKGQLYIADDEERHVLQEGEFLLMAPRTRQFGYQGSDCSFYWLHFTAEEQSAAPILVEKYEARTGHMMIPRQGALQRSDKIIVMMKQLQDSVRSYQDPTLNNFLATSILYELYKQCDPGTNAVKKELKQLQLYNDIADYIKWHRFEPLKVSQIADHFGYNAKYLSYLFSTISGMSLKHFIMKQKIEAASFLLTDTNQSINEIAMQLGYCDSHHFMKSFKQMTNLTPTSFRNASAKRLLYYK
ncbi:AraC family transcriptional regulator [Paenibacillus harenae]|uniref:AraC family transcriptional regulator n=1 Tax=Paenibacillus harenae TaxID=306543 RepID=UPI000424A22E|nr:AraC family transcriptional regulator [Paenibacillus harenae]